LNAGTQPMRFPVNWSAAVYAGVIAGILATVVQIALWSVFTDAFPAILFRDARFAAAIVMGRGVLPPTASLTWPVMLVATAVHFALSIAYGLTLPLLISRLRTLPSLVAGVAFGLLLYGVNMYGFTTVFPWFEATRDWITLVTHMSFGVAVAGSYEILRCHAGVRHETGND
jgi:hypothetical protein